MYQIALCDDSPIILEQIQRMLMSFPEGADLLIKPFQSGIDLKAALRSGQQYDLIILDVQLDGMSGIEIAKLLRNELQERMTPIIYISGYRDYMMELLQTQAFDFLEKPIRPEFLHRSLKNAMAAYAVSKVCFECVVEKTKRRIPCCTIQYIESQDKRIMISTTAGMLNSYGKLSELIERLPPEFIMIHKSFVVNENFVTEHAHDHVTLSNGVVLPISRTLRDKVNCSLWSSVDMPGGVGMI